MIIKFLKTPFPQIEKPAERFWFSVGVALFVYFFLLVFQPFGIDRLKLNIPIFLTGYMLITLVVLLVNYFIMFPLFPKFFNPDTWTTGKILLMASVEIALIATLNWGYSILFSKYIPIEISFEKFFFNTFSIGILILFITVLASEHYLKFKNRKLARRLNDRIHNKSVVSGKELFIPSENKNESFIIPGNHLLCIKAEGNYCNVFYLENGRLESKLIRISLTKLEKVLIPMRKYFVVINLTW